MPISTLISPLLQLRVPATVQVRFRALRDGEVTAGKKLVRLARSVADIERTYLVRESLDSEYTGWVTLPDQVLADTPTWLAFVEDSTPPAKVHAQYLAIPGAGTYTIDIGESFPRHLLQGDGYLSGSFPDGITTLNGVPVAATVRAHYRPAGGEPGDGLLVASTESAADGTWIISGLNPDLKFDIIGRLNGQNDVIAANVQPMTLGG